MKHAAAAILLLAGCATSTAPSGRAPAAEGTAEPLPVLDRTDLADAPASQPVFGDVPAEPVTFDGPVYDPDVPGAEDAVPLVRLPPSGFERCVTARPTRDIVKMTLDVDVVGQPANVRVVRSSNDCLNRSAVRAVERARYRPATIDGEPVPRLGMVFNLIYEMGV